MEKINIRAPFYSAGKQYHWVDKYASIGLGINLNKVKACDKIEITVGDLMTKYILDCKKALKFGEEYQSYFTARTTRLIVLPWISDLFEKINLTPEMIGSSMRPQVVQASLF